LLFLIAAALRLPLRCLKHDSTAGAGCQAPADSGHHGISQNNIKLYLSFKDF